MKGFAIFLTVILVAAAPAAAISVSDILKGSTDAALRQYSRQVMPVDGWAKLRKGEALVIRGAAFWNPDYYIVFREGKVRFWGPIPRSVDVSVEAYKVYFGVLAVPAGDYKDIWWTRERVGGGWVGDFFVSDFKWRWFGGESDVGKAWIAYNAPGITDLAAEDLNLNLSIQSVPELELEVVEWESRKKMQLGRYILLR